jgi:hypothetical protein
MKKLTTAFAAVLALAIATPAVLACPHEEKAQADKKQEPQTAEQGKAKTEKKADTTPAAKDTAKKDTAAAPKADGGKVSSK